MKTYSIPGVLLLLCMGFTIQAQQHKTNLPPVSALPVIDTMPDLFTFRDGSKVTDLAFWEKRRNELKQLVQYYEYGFIPDPGGKVHGVVRSSQPFLQAKAEEREVSISCGPEGQMHFTLFIYKPAGKGRFPVIITGDKCWYSMKDKYEGFLKRGYILAEFDRTEIDPDNANRNNGIHLLYPGQDFGTLAAWAWGYMRVVDYLEGCDFVDNKEIIITGHSRGGKAALLAGAFDNRVAMVVPNGSGCGGTGSMRYVFTGETLNDITDSTKFPYWFNTQFLSFRNNNLKRLPFDQDALIALVAPRAYLSTNAMGDAWANPEGAQKTHLSAIRAWKMYGVSGETGIHYREGQHAQNDEDWLALLDFADFVFLHKGSVEPFERLPYTH